MKQVKYLIICFCFIIISCSQNEKVDKDILNKDSLINVIVDMHLGDAILMEPSVATKQITINKPEYYSAILKKHSVTKENFQKSIDFYSQNPEEYETIYETVVEKITLLQSVILSKDSLNNKTEE
jgi:hypothetical protein